MYTKTELKKIAEEQDYIYVVLNDDIKIIKYPTKLINFNCGRRALLDLNDYGGECTVYKELEDAYDCVKVDIDFQLEESTEEYIYEQNELREKKALATLLDKQFLEPFPFEKVIYVNVVSMSGNVMERIMTKLSIKTTDIYTSNKRDNYFITYDGVKYVFNNNDYGKIGLKIDEEINEVDL